MVQAVLFDIDGTLVDSNDLHVAAWREAFREFGKDLSFEQVHEQIGKGGDQLIPVFCSAEEIARFGDALDRVQAEIFTRKYLPQVKPFPEVRALFERIRRDGLRIALASSSKKHEVEAHKKTLGIGDLVEITTSGDEVERSKPCPDVFQAARDALRDVTASEAIVVGDTPYDAVAARRSGMRAIGVLSGGFEPSQLEGAGAIEVYRDIADLLARYDTCVLARGRRSRA
ncbi:MAG TPA: HAD family phosphatase [Casimicrobiaceae bacterium]|nr:HAD family phosphatase [Casimicrobiaceae bacterium]